MNSKCILILDFGSQYTQLITRRVRELGHYSYVLPGNASLDNIEKLNPSAIILSGGPSSVFEDDSPKPITGFWEWADGQKLPLLGICYGMQLIVQRFGGSVKPGVHREYGETDLKWISGSKLLESWRKGSQTNELLQKVWMSHGDVTESIPKHFSICAQSESGAIAAIEYNDENNESKIYGLQFHPEVTHTEDGINLLKGFIEDICGLRADWNMSEFKKELLAKIKTEVSGEDHVICALSGGVDSTVAATLVHAAIGDRLHCVFVDHGLLRFEEQSRVMKLFREQLHLPVECVDASSLFLSALRGVTDPEEKRKIIGREFISVFREYAHGLEKKLGHFPKFLVQGTLYPDVIESSPASGTNGSHSKTIKSHHNVGGLPKDLPFQLIEPLRDLFKDEVRTLGRVLEVPDDFLNRHPFPGPGLAVRIIGEISTERIKMLQEADEIFIAALKEFSLYSEIWQAFVVFLPIKTVGVQGDGRTHDHVIALRAVTSSDGMTANWFEFDGKFLRTVSNRICNRVKGINRVVYDISSKPPATIEWE